MELSLLGVKVHGNKSSCYQLPTLLVVNYGVSGFFVPLPFRLLADSPPGFFASWLFRSLADSPSHLRPFALIV